MTKEKQIEEMTRSLLLKHHGIECFCNCTPCGKCSSYYYSETLYNEGYRKQMEGEWIAKPIMIRSPFARNYYCSVCKYEPIDIGSFCPNCGAKMKGGSE